MLDERGVPVPGEGGACNIHNTLFMGVTCTIVHMAVARSSSGGVALWTMSYLHTMARNGRREKEFTQSDSIFIQGLKPSFSANPGFPP